MSQSSHPEFPYVAFLAAMLVLVPLPWHWRAGNVATLSIIAWLFVLNVIYAVDAIVWAHNVNIVIPVWCDITTKIIIGATMALPAACMCVTIHLEQVASIRSIRTSAADKRRRQYIETGLCLLLPIIWMAVHYCVQGHRFDIIEDYGCRPNTYVSIPAIFLIWVPPLIMSAITSIYAAFALKHFLSRRVTFAKHLENSSSGLTTSRYLRLILMSVVEMCISVASTSVSLWFTTLSLRPWTNWSDVHWNFSRIDTYPLPFTPQLVLNVYYALWMFIPLSTYVFFLFFAFGQDAMTEYRACFKWILSHLPQRRNSDTCSSKRSDGIFPPSPPSEKLSRNTVSTSPHTIQQCDISQTDAFTVSALEKDHDIYIVQSKDEGSIVTSSYSSSSLKSFDADADSHSAH